MNDLEMELNTKAAGLKMAQGHFILVEVRKDHEEIDRDLNALDQGLATSSLQAASGF